MMILTDHGAIITYDDYDENNRPRIVSYPNGMTINLDWDGAGRVRRIQAVTPASGPLVDLRYQYVPGSNLLHCFTDTDGTIAVYSYDVLNQLTAEDRHTGLPSDVCTDQQLIVGSNAGHRAWTYDANNNRASQILGLQPRQTTTLYQYDDADELASTSTPGFPGFGTTITDLFPPGFGTTTINSYAYDRDGNLTDRSDGLRFDYDAANHTTGITPPLIAGGAANKLVMQYSGLDQTQRTSLKVGGAPATLFTYDGTGIGPSILQPGAAGAAPSFITRTPGDKLVSLRRGGNTYFYITDRLGSVVALTTGSSAKFGPTSVANRYRYSPWGEILPQSVETVPQPFRFAGAEYDASTGLYKMGARYYDPAIGRFTQIDRLGGGGRQYAVQTQAQCRAIACERKLDDFAGQCLSFAIEQRFDCERGAVACTLGLTRWAAALALDEWAPPLISRCIYSHLSQSSIGKGRLKQPGGLRNSPNGSGTQDNP